MFHSRRNIPLLLAQTVLLFLAACAPTNREGAASPTTQDSTCDKKDASEVTIDRIVPDDPEDWPYPSLILAEWGASIKLALPSPQMWPLEGTPITPNLLKIVPNKEEVFGVASIPYSQGYAYGLPTGQYFVPEDQNEVMLTTWSEGEESVSRKTLTQTYFQFCFEPVKLEDAELYPSLLRGWMK